MKIFNTPFTRPKTMTTDRTTVTTFRSGSPLRSDKTA